MSTLDWLIILFYITAMVAFGVYVGRHQSNDDDYYVGARKFKWWMVGISTMATQTSAISFISIPAFVAIKQSGGISWLQYEIAVPLAMIFSMVVLIPLLRELKLISVYQYLELRFNAKVRRVASIVFLISRGLGTGVALYAASIVLSVCANLPVWQTILIIGIATIVYDVFGGIRAVIYSDIIQLVVLLFGLFACVIYASQTAGGFFMMFDVFPASRQQALDPSIGFNDDSSTPFWAFLIGGFFLYTSYYGTDQSQVQRGLSAESAKHVRYALAFNGLARFPLTLLYIVLGIAMYSSFVHSDELQELVGNSKPDFLVPHFIITELPSGLRGLLFAALLAATMSSLDSALNSISAVTLKDFVEPHLKDTSNMLTAGRIVTFIWGVFITLFAFFVGDISDTVIEGINKIGSAFYGPILACFVIGILNQKITATAILFGLVIGVTANILCWLLITELHWMWWNVSGFFITSVLALIITKFNLTPKPSINADLTLNYAKIWKREKDSLPLHISLALYFFIILLVIIYI